MSPLASPSARKVWIEIKTAPSTCYSEWGHLPQGRCGLKYLGPVPNEVCTWSPSARKVWIEIVEDILAEDWLFVTFRKEGVD